MNVLLNNTDNGPGTEKQLLILFGSYVKQVQALLYCPFYFLPELDRLGGDNELVFALTQNGVVIAQVGTAQGVDKNPKAQEALLK